MYHFYVLIYATCNRGDHATMYNVKILLGKRDGNFVIHERRQNFCSNGEIIFYTRYISLLKCILRPKYFSIRDNWITFSMRYEILRKKKFHIFFFLFSCRNYKNNESKRKYGRRTNETFFFFFWTRLMMNQFQVLMNSKCLCVTIKASLVL